MAIEYDEILLNFSSRVDAKGLKSAVNSLEKLKDINGFSGLRQAGQDLRGFIDALDGISHKRLQAVTDLANAMKGLKGSAKAMKAVSNVAEKGNPLNDTSMGEAPVPQMASSMQQVAESAKEAKEATKGTEKEAKKALTPMEKLANRFKSFLQYRAMRAVWSAITNGIKEGFDNLEAWDRRMGHTGFAESMDRARESLLVLKNSLAVVGAPFLEGLISMLQQVAQWAMAGANALSRLIAIIGGKSSYRAVKWADYTANAVKATTGAIKNAGKEFKKQLMAFDEINNITEQKGSSGGGGYGNSGYFNYDDMFEERTVGEMSEVEKKLKQVWERIKKIGSELQPIFSKLKLLKETFSSMWETTVKVASAVATWVGELASPVWSGFKTTLNSIVNFAVSFGTAIGTAYKAIGNLIIAIGNITDAFGIWKSIGGDINLILQTFSKLLDGASKQIMALALVFEMLSLQASYVAEYFAQLKAFLNGDISFKEFTSNVQKAKKDLETNMANAVDNTKKKMDELFGKKYTVNIDNTKATQTKEVVYGTKEVVDNLTGQKHTVKVTSSGITVTNDALAGVQKKVDDLEGTYTVTVNTTENVTRNVSEYKTTYALKGGRYVQEYAQGGFVDTGQMFVAREAGAELVGNIGGRTAVMNNDQIVTAVSQGVASAVASVLGGGTNVNVTLEGDAKGLFRVVQQESRAYTARTGQFAMV